MTLKRLGSVRGVGKPQDTADTANNAFTPLPWNPAADGGSVRSLAVGGDNVYAAGSFGGIGGKARAGLARVSTAGAVDDAWDPKAAGGSSNAIAVNGSTVYAGGDFTSLNSSEAKGIAALNPDGTLDTNWHASADDGGKVQVLALSPDEGTLYMGGGFTSVSGGTKRNYLAALRTSDGGVTPWNPNLGGWPLALQANGSTVYVGGAFDTVGGLPRPRLAAIDAGTGVPSDWNPGADGNVTSLAFSCGTLYAGGSFQNIGGAERNRLAALRTSSGAATGWDPDANSSVLSLALDGSRIVAGGRFGLIGGALRSGLAAIDLGTGKATKWNPSAGTAGSGIVNAVALSPDHSVVYAAGLFTKMGDDDRGRLAALDAVTGTATPWSPNADLRAYAVATSGGAVYVGGSFRQVGEWMQQGFGSFNGGAAALGAPAPTSCPAEGGGGSGGSSGGSGNQPLTQPSDRRRPGPLALKSFKVKPPRFRALTPAEDVARLKVEAQRQALADAKAKVDGKKPESLHPIPHYTTFVFELTTWASVRIRINRELPGVRKAGQCVAPARRLLKVTCTRYQLYGVLSPKVHGGTNRIRFRGRFRGSPLPPGVYTARLIATDAARKHTFSKTRRFQVLGP